MLLQKWCCQERPVLDDLADAAVRDKLKWGDARSKVDSVNESDDDTDHSPLSRFPISWVTSAGFG